MVKMCDLWQNRGFFSQFYKFVDEISTSCRPRACILGLGQTVSVLGREEGYTVKYGLSSRDCPRAQLEADPKGSGLILLYIPT